MNQRNVECTCNPSMVDFWGRANEDWAWLAKSAHVKRDWKMEQFYSDLAEKAEKQIEYIQGQMQISGESVIKVGTHGNTMNVNSRVIRTPNGTVQR